MYEVAKKVIHILIIDDIYLNHPEAHRDTEDIPPDRSLGVRQRPPATKSLGTRGEGFAADPQI